MCGLHYGRVSVLIPMHFEAQGVSADAGPAGCGCDVKGTVPSHGFSVRLSLAGHGAVPVPASPWVACGSAATIPTPFPSALRGPRLPAFCHPLATCLGAHLCFRVNIWEIQRTFYPTDTFLHQPPFLKNQL